MNLKEREWKDVDWIHGAQIRVVNTLMNRRVAQTVRVSLAN
jgi:hypothetical protein